MSSDRIGLAEPDLSGNEAAYLAECVASGFVSSVGPFVTRFERDLAYATGTTAAAATQSGSSALYLALRVMGVRPGDLVIAPSYTYIATANAIRLAGAEPWLFDVEPVGWTLDPGLLRSTLERETVQRNGKLHHIATGARVGAIMPVYTLGAVPMADAIRAIAHDFGLPVIGDAAAAIGPPELARTADLVCLSFNGNKTLTCGGGGAVVGADPDRVDHARRLGAQARARDGSYTHDETAFNFRMTNLQAAVGVAQLERLDQLLAAKRRIRAAYDEAIADLPGFGPLPAPPWSDAPTWLSGVIAPTAETARAVSTELNARGIHAGSFWRPVHLQPPYANAPCTRMDVCESVWDRVITLPCSASLSPERQSTVIDALNEIVRTTAHCAA
ncbi:MAG: pyridoxal-5'-phosphate-dependent protein [Phycisphaerae bacterium]|nr:pyridoxal-5'-phosphate-dependent protein [Phycisphaerae bacterium]